ncbi:MULTISPECIES: DsbA family oxidoreductase [unclassified Streptomyces]|uniref:DsbA family oxidoreductase n=1 Tax=unclassified Streptomyces TaxID=2593676 RepID=UPI00364719C1
MKIEIYSDVLCPWCYIGKSRIAKALDGFAHRDAVEVVWRSFELAPDADGVPGVTAAEAMEQWTDPAAVPARIALIRSNGEQEGVELNLHKSRPVSTFDAHRLIHLATARGRVDAVLEGLFHAYHTDALNVADPEVLSGIAATAGLDADEVKELLEGDRYADRVAADERRAVRLGVSGVPSVVIDGRPPVSGVQDPAALTAALEAAWAQRAKA